MSSCPAVARSCSATSGVGSVKSRWQARTSAPVRPRTAATSSSTTNAARGSRLPWESSRTAGPMVASDVPLVVVQGLAGQRVADHAGGQGGPGLRVDEQERAGAAAGGVRLGHDRVGGAQPDPADVVEPEVLGADDLDLVEVEHAVDGADDGARGAGGVLEQHPAALAQRHVGEPAD